LFKCCWVSQENWQCCMLCEGLHCCCCCCFSCCCCCCL
jgi:hypothetical protein